MTLDFVAAQAVARARLLERAVHDPGPWQIQVGEITVDTVKVKTARRVIFLAHFDSQGVDSDVAWLYCRGELLTSMPVEVTSGSHFDIEWEIAMEGSADERVGV